MSEEEAIGRVVVLVIGAMVFVLGFLWDKKYRKKRTQENKSYFGNGDKKALFATGIIIISVLAVMMVYASLTG